MPMVYASLTTYDYFRLLVEQIIKKGLQEEQYKLDTWGRIGFLGLDIDERTLRKAMDDIKRAYGKYIVYRSGGEYGFKIDQIRKDFPQFAYSPQDTTQTQKKTIVNRETVNQKAALVNSKAKTPVKKPRVFKAPTSFPSLPKSSHPSDLFEFAVKRLAYHCQKYPDYLEPKTFKEWVGICFSKSDVQDALKKDYMSKIKQNNKPYFIEDKGRRFTWNVEEIEADFPQFFKATAESVQGLSPIQQMVRDLEVEAKLARNPKVANCCQFEDLNLRDRANKIYQLSLILKEDDVFDFYEGIKLKLKIDDYYYDAEGIEFEEEDEILFISTKEILPPKNSGFLWSDTSFILLALRDILEPLIASRWPNSYPLEKLFTKETDHLVNYPIRRLANEIAKVLDLDDSQSTALIQSVGHDVSFIWGPPGTGKSYTLSALIDTFFKLEEKTLVCCLSNVAVDQLLNKVLDTLAPVGIKPLDGQMLRVGSTIDSRILSEDFLFPKDAYTQQIRQRIRAINQKIEAFQKISGGASAILALKKERTELREDLKKRTENIITKARLIFSTNAHFILSDTLKGASFDNLIVDEASMLSVPYLLALAKNVCRRIIIVGDPNQLAPIALSSSKWLTTNIFAYCKVLSNEPISLHRLLVQRRSHQLIVGLTNRIFYEGKLQAPNTYIPRWVDKSPFQGKVVKVINDEEIVNSEIKWMGRTRGNITNFQRVMDILDRYEPLWYSIKDGGFSIGGVTPYRGQVKNYKKEIKRNIRSSYHSDYWRSIKVGTVHTFQGSECDLIIFDLVEHHSEGMGKLWEREKGEQLITVALTRARYQLIVVGETQRFAPPGTLLSTMSAKSAEALYRLKDFPR